MCAALPRAVRIRKEYPDREPLCQALVLGHLFALIVGRRVAQRSPSQWPGTARVATSAGRSAIGVKGFYG